MPSELLIFITVDCDDIKLEMSLAFKSAIYESKASLSMHTQHHTEYSYVICASTTSLRVSKFFIVGAPRLDHLLNRL